MCSLILLAAADIGWIKLVVPVVAFFIYIINHFIAESKQARKRPPVRKPAAGMPNPSQRPGGTQTVAPDEIEEFLRRAAQQRKQAAQGKTNAPTQAQPRKPQPVVRDPRTGMAKPSHAPNRPQPPSRRGAEQPVDIEVVQSGRQRESVGEHVAKRLSTDEFKTRTAQMGEDIARADQEREQHHKKMFGHHVGKLSTPDATAEDKPAAKSPPIAGIAAGTLGGLLQGDTLRYAVVLNQILTRPEHRW